MVKQSIARSRTTLISYGWLIVSLLQLNLYCSLYYSQKINPLQLGVVVQCYVTKQQQRWHRSSSLDVVNRSRLFQRSDHHRFLHSSSSSFSSSLLQSRRKSIRNLQLSEKKSTDSQQVTVRLDMTLTDERIRKLYAWICQAFYANDERYDNLMYAMVAVFGNLPIDSPIITLLDRAIQKFDSSISNNYRMGEALSQYERERASLGAMGAGQWMGQYMTRPHALLDISNYTTIQDWERTLPRGCKRTIQRAIQAQVSNYTVISKPIQSNDPAPHSTYEHFKCVVQHEVRLLSNMYGGVHGDDDLNNDDNDYDKVSVVLNALSEAINRYMGTTQMTGLIREYRNSTTNEVIAFAHEVRKGQTVRGQWFYATDIAAKQYVWFHSVRSLIERSIQENNNNNNITNDNVKDTNINGIDNIATTTTSSTTSSSAFNSILPFLYGRTGATGSMNQSSKITIVDLGPSGSDDFSDLKSKYGFISVDDWPSIANYHGPFWDYSTNTPVKNGVKY